MDINPKEVVRLANSQQDAHRNPYMGRADNGPYLLGHLFRELPSRRERASEEELLKAEAARQHAENGTRALTHGLQSIGALMIRAGMGEDGDLEGTDVLSLGDLIQHLAVELRFLHELEGHLDDVLFDRVPVAQGGA